MFWTGRIGLRDGQENKRWATCYVPLAQQKYWMLRSAEICLLLERFILLARCDPLNPWRMMHGNDSITEPLKPGFGWVNPPLTGYLCVPWCMITEYKMNAYLDSACTILMKFQPLDIELRWWKHERWNRKRVGPVQVGLLLGGKKYSLKVILCAHLMASLPDWVFTIPEHRHLWIAFLSSVPIFRQVLGQVVHDRRLRKLQKVILYTTLDPPWLTEPHPRSCSLPPSRASLNRITCQCGTTYLYPPQKH